VDLNLPGRPKTGKLDAVRLAEVAGRQMIWPALADPAHVDGTGMGEHFHPVPWAGVIAARLSVPVRLAQEVVHADGSHMAPSDGTCQYLGWSRSDVLRVCPGPCRPDI
jgi:hypothetical protein